MEQIQSVASDLVVNVVVGLLGLLAAYATYGIKVGASKLRLQAQQIQSTEQRRLFLAALDDVEALTGKTVAAVEQTTAKALREAVKAGTADPEALKQLALDAAVEIKAALQPSTVLLITKHLGNFDDYLAKCIEAKVLELKGGAAAKAG